MTETHTITSMAAARLPVAAIRRAGTMTAMLEPDADWRAALVAGLDLLGLRKLRMNVTISVANDGLELTGHLGATVLQPCVVTLDPVTTRIEAPVLRRYLEHVPEPLGEEIEIPEDDSVEHLGMIIDLAALLSEVLALNVPTYPRTDGAELPPGAQMIDTSEGEEEVARPFASLESLRTKLEDDQG